MVDHTTKRLLSTILELLKRLPTEVTDLSFEWKWGFDSSSSHNEYKQVSVENAVDTDILLTAVVPLQLYAFNNGKFSSYSSIFSFPLDGSGIMESCPFIQIFS